MSYTICMTCNGEGVLIDDQDFEVARLECDGTGRIEYEDDEFNEFEDDDFPEDDDTEEV